MKYSFLIKIAFFIMITVLVFSALSEAGYWQRQGEAYYLLKDAKNGGRSWCDLRSCSFNSASISVADLFGNDPTVYIDYIWDTPRNIIKPGDILDVHASFARKNVMGSLVEGGSGLAYFLDLPKSNTGARVDFLGLWVALGAERGLDSGKAANTKVKAPEGVSGDREIRIRIDSFLEVAFPYKWVEHEPNPADIIHSPEESPEVPVETNTIVGSWEIGRGGMIGSENEKTIYYKGELTFSVSADGKYSGILNFKIPGYGPEKLTDITFNPEAGVIHFTRPGLPQYYIGILVNGGLFGVSTQVDSLLYWQAKR